MYVCIYLFIHVFAHVFLHLSNLRILYLLTWSETLDSFFGDSVIQLELFSFLGNYFMQGSCQKADSCVFAHGPHELRTPGA